MAILLLIILFFIFLATVAGISKPELFARNGNSIPTRRKIISASVGTSLLLLFLISIAARSGNETAPTQAEPRAAPTAPNAPAPTASAMVRVSSEVKMEPETFVKFPNSSIACLSKESLNVVTTHLIRGENTKAEAYFPGGDRDQTECIMLPRTMKFKVLAVEYNNPNIPELGIMEIVFAKAKSSEGMWVFTAGAVKQK